MQNTVVRKYYLTIVGYKEKKFRYKIPIALGRINRLANFLYERIPHDGFRYSKAFVI